MRTEGFVFLLRIKITDAASLTSRFVFIFINVFSAFLYLKVLGFFKKHNVSIQIATQLRLIRRSNATKNIIKILNVINYIIDKKSQLSSNQWFE